MNDIKEKLVKANNLKKSVDELANMIEVVEGAFRPKDKNYERDSSPRGLTIYAEVCTGTQSSTQEVSLGKYGSLNVALPTLFKVLLPVLESEKARLEAELKLLIG